MNHSRQVGARFVQLEALDTRAVEEVVQDMIGAAPSVELLEVVNRAHGSPFLLVELLRGLREESLLRVEAGEATPIESRLPARLSIPIEDRLSTLSDEAMHIARIAAALGRRFTIDQLSALRHRTPQG